MDMDHVVPPYVRLEPAGKGMRVLEGLAPLTGEKDRRHPFTLQEPPQFYGQAARTIGVARGNEQLGSLSLKSAAHLENRPARSAIASSHARDNM